MNDPLAELKATVANISRQAVEIGPADDAVAFAFVTDLAASLDGVPALLNRVLDLVEIAAPGPPTRERVLSRLDDLRRLRQRIEADREELERLRPILEELRAAETEHGRLTAELTDLLRLRELAGELHDLKAQRARMTDQYEELTAVGTTERELATSAAAVVTLTKAQLTKVGEGIAETLAEAERTGRSLTEAKKVLAAERTRLDRLGAELSEAVEGFATLREQSERRLPSIEAYRLAQRRLLEGIGSDPSHNGSGVDHANTALDELDQRLADVKAALKIALVAHDETYEQARALLPVQ
ncbi:hypothetical protein B0I32_105414 [Nonomuraea fuscirosea]|uniref:Uncharacterized protein n=1 Tax=Nonomuraea fuscirosea TaxID=1291556 RepID=A0A2T0N463_9ACTN|nr:hypothetical protein [Nonomuraea fuscirosea]PRX66974.1 hypothetical protein B0I32_105414 [Nonomuraea fuscirosea]